MQIIEFSKLDRCYIKGMFCMSYIDIGCCQIALSYTKFGIEFL